MLNNTVLLDKHREQLKQTIDALYTLVPEMMSRKIPRANVQQAFAFKYIKDNIPISAKLMCAGSYEDTCCAALKVLGYDITEVDPVYNSDLHTYCINNNYKQFDCVFSVSVIEHVENDNEFVEDMCKSLKPGGTCVVTCDFKNDYVPGDPKPGCDYRFYTSIDIMIRFKNILEKNNCYIDGPVDYKGQPDFVFEGYLYTFGTFVFKKKM